MDERAQAANAIAESIMSSFQFAKRDDHPFEMWTLDNILPPSPLENVINLPIDKQEINDDYGSRENNNSTRSYFAIDNRIAFDICQDIAIAFQRRNTIEAIQEVCSIDLTGTFLRIEYAQDSGEFYLDAHCDIPEKKLTIQLWLSKENTHDVLGTDLYQEVELESSDEMGYKHVATTPFKSNSALVFIPADDTWHGFEPKWIDGIRKSLIINYVKDWRATEELCFPNTPI